MKFLHPYRVEARHEGFCQVCNITKDGIFEKIESKLLTDFENKNVSI